MNGLIVAGIASIAGIAGVAGLTLATAGTAPPPAPPAVSAEAPGVLAQRLARVREAERAADAALRRADLRAVAYSRGAGAGPPAPVSAAAPARSDEGYQGDDDAGEYGGDDGGRGRDHEEDD
jgi:hypothetical protein